MRGWHLAAPYKIPLEVHWSFLIIAAIFIASQGLFNGLLFSLVIGLSIVVHEYGHALVARERGYSTEYICLYLFGGAAWIRGLEDVNHDDEIAISLAGPATNLVWVIIGTLFLALTGWKVWGLVITINLLLGLFNLIPALPLDGGRILRAWLCKRLGYTKATQVSVKIGQGFSILFFAIGLATGHYDLVIVSLLIMLFASAEEKRVVS